MTSYNINLNGYHSFTGISHWGDPTGYITMTLTVLSSGVVYGSGSTTHGAFKVSGALIDDEIRFVLNYSIKRMRYIGKRLAVARGNVFQFAGAWGYCHQETTLGYFAITGTVTSGLSPPTHPLEGQWVGEYANGVDPSATKQRTAVVVSLRPGVTWTPTSALASIVGIGNDDVGTFKMSGSCKLDGTWEMVKYYDCGYIWDYKGKLNGSNNIAGFWSHVSGAIGGAFTLTKQEKLDTLISTQNMPTGGEFGVVVPATLESILQEAANSWNQGIPAVCVQSSKAPLRP
ncbi:hypothetical protein CVT24_003902 [Panaeolus cyanescens]|uniref:Uncharacterized protein n=1 Tax=Panaeolus cyanescens TaxID=181874 RepID=A0A409YXK4_9AGAR|nr:hypothetical protein CVT24_003902 [Panaeolus cyanescens]